MTYSAHYQKQLLKLHETKQSFGTKSGYKGVDEWIEKYQPASIIDYGCGKGMLLASLVEKHNLKGIGYDPGVKEFMNLPTEPADVLVSTDVLEHIEPNYINEVLAQIDRLYLKSAWLLIDTAPAIKVLADGRNAHLILEDHDWWTSKILETMPNSTIVSNRIKKNKIIMELVKSGTNTTKP